MQCPACRAENEQKPICRRCRADLSLLWAVEEQRESLVRAAGVCLRRGQMEQALERLSLARELRLGADVDRLESLAHLLAGNFAEAMRHHRTACG